MRPDNGGFCLLSGRAVLNSDVTNDKGAASVMAGACPSEVAGAAAEAGIPGAECLFSVRSDLALDGSTDDVWLVVGRGVIAAFSTGKEGARLVSGPFSVAAIQKVRCFQTVGSAFLQFRIDGLYVSSVRYSNSRREAFSRARIQINRLTDGQPVQAEALLRASEMSCGKCGLPLPSRGAACSRCGRHHGIFVRSLGLMRPYWRAMSLLLGMMLAGVGLDLIPPQLTRILVDSVLPRKDMAALPLILLGLVSAAGLRCLLNVSIGRISSMVGTRITRELRERLQQKLMSLSVDYYNRHSVGSLMGRVAYEVDYFQGFVAQVAQGFVPQLLVVLGVGTMLFFMNWKLALLVLVPIPFVVIGTIIFWKKIYPRYYRFWDSQSKMTQLLSGLLSGVRMVKTFGQEEREKGRFSNCAGNMQEARRRLEMGSATFNPIMTFVFGLGGMIVWYAGGRMIMGEEISLGVLMAFFGYLGMFYGPISAMSMFSNWVTGFLSAGQRVFEVLDSGSMLPESASPVRARHLAGAIEFKGVTFGYDPYLPVLKNVSFRIEPGEFVGVVGKSGSGKTTIVNLICRFYDCQQGQVLIDGHDVKDIMQEDIHRQIGLVLQEPFLFRGTIAENIAYGRPDSTPMEIVDAARSANAHEFTSRRALGYDTRLGEHGAGLSGGERQRISIARALLCDPRVLILDEATSSVDTESEQEIQKAFATLCKGRTTIAIAHRLSTLKNSDRILVIDDGKLAETGTHEELMARTDGIYHKLVKIQTELTRIEE
jgi:ATP-binding cassette subfamily B protein